jgi:transketolase N-terminal domain/subunit
MPTRREFANAIRALSMDAVQKANSGHPGAPMGMADIAELLWRDVLKFNPGNPLWWRSRPFRIVERPCLHVAVFGAASHGLPIANGRVE